MLKAIILIGGPLKGTRFRPLSLDLPKPLFPVAGFPVVYHHIEACSKVPSLREILLIGFYQPNELLQRFIISAIQEFKIQIRYLQEYTSLGTAGGIYHFRDQILAGNPEYFFVMNADVCSDFPLLEMLEFHTKKGNGNHATIMGTEVLHYVEKPETFVSSTINCGVYLFSPDIFITLASAFQKHQDEHFSAAIYANRHYLSIYHRTHPDRLAENGHDKPKITGDVFIHPSALVDPSSVLGPNVTIGKNVVVGAGVRVRESIVLQGANLRDHSCIMYSIIGWNSMIGAWTRVEGTPNDPNPNKPFAKLEITELFTDEGRLNPSITVIGSNVQVPSEVIVLNSIVLPHKDLNRSYKNQIIL